MPTTTQPAAGTALPATALTAGAVHARNEADTTASTVLAGSATRNIVGTGPAYATDAEGRYKQSAGDANAEYWSGLNFGPEYTLIVIFKWASSGGVQTLFDSDQNPPRNFIFRTTAAGNVEFIPFDTAGGNINVTSASAASTTGYSVAIARVRNDAGTYRAKVWLNGTGSAETAFATTPEAISSAADVLYSVDRWGGGGNATAQKKYFELVLNRAISDTEGNTIGANGWTLFDGGGIGQASEADLAQAISSGRYLTVQAAEADEAQPLVVLDVAQAGDLFLFGDDTGNESTFGGLRLFGGQPAATGGSSITIGQASESDSAQALTRQQRASIGQPTETDAAQALTVVRTLAIGQAAETDSAQALASRQARTVGQPAEADAAQPLAAQQARGVAQALETDSAQALTISTAKVLGQAAETDAAQALLARQQRTLGQPAETDTAQVLAVSLPGTLGQAAEADSAQPLQSAQRRALGQALEADSAQPAALSTAKAIGQAAETDAAQAFVQRLLRQAGQALEADTAQPVSRGGTTVAAGQAAELDAALAMARRQLAAIGIAFETDAALQLTVVGAGGPLVMSAGRRRGRSAPQERPAQLSTARRPKVTQ